MDFEKEILEGFVVESREHLASIEDDFLLLEKQRDKPDKELVHKVFRAIHTVKGAAGFLGLIKISELTHVMETILSNVRSGEMSPEAQMVDLMLEGVDLLKTLLDDIEGTQTLDISSTVKKMKQMLTREDAETSKLEPEAKKLLKTVQGEDTGFTIPVRQAVRLQEQGHYLHILKYDLEEARKTRGKSPMRIINELAMIGEILEGRLNTPLEDLSQSVEDAPLFYHVLFDTQLTAETIKDVLALKRDRIQTVLEPKLESNITAPAPQIASSKMSETKTVLPPEPAVSTPNHSQSQTPESQEPTKFEIATEDGPGPEILSPSPVGETVGQPMPTAATSVEKSGVVRIPVAILDRLMNLAGELVLVRNQQLSHFSNADPLSRSMVQRLNTITSELQEIVMRTRMQPLSNVLGKYPRIVREMARKLSKKIELVTSGDEVELDKTILESLADPLTHIIRNSCDHGLEAPDERKAAGKPETGRITINAFHEAGYITIQINDDGRGVNLDAVKKKALEKKLRSVAELASMSDKEALYLVMLPGFSTARQISDVSGRGVGMDVVKSNIEKLNGSISLESQAGKGTSITLKLPLTLAIIPCLMVSSGSERYAIPQINLEELVALYDEETLTRIECAEDKELFRLRDTLLPMIRLSDILASPDPFSRESRAERTEFYRKQREEELKLYREIIRREGEEAVQFTRSLNFAVLSVNSRRFGLIIDKVLGAEEIVVKPMHPLLGSLRCYSGSTVLGDGSVALILDADSIAAHSGIFEEDEKTGLNVQTVQMSDTGEQQSLLLFKAGSPEQFALALPMIKRIEHILSSNIEKVGDKEFITVDDVSTLVLRLNHCFNISSDSDREEMFLILPKFIGQPFGILASHLIDIVHVNVALNTESYMEDGLLGASIINQKMTLFIDMYRLIEKAEPNWFKTRQKKQLEKKINQNILIVEDTSFFREVVKGYLKSDGFQIKTAENGEEALQILEKESFSLIVSDLEMPVMDGWTFISRLKAKEESRHTPVVALTALDSPEIRSEVLRAGFDCYETKLNRERLLLKINQILEKQENPCGDNNE